MVQVGHRETTRIIVETAFKQDDASRDFVSQVTITAHFYHRWNLAIDLRPVTSSTLPFITWTTSSSLSQFNRDYALHNGQESSFNRYASRRDICTVKMPTTRTSFRFYESEMANFAPRFVILEIIP